MSLSLCYSRDGDTILPTAEELACSGGCRAEDDRRAKAHGAEEWAKCGCTVLALMPRPRATRNGGGVTCMGHLLSASHRLPATWRDLGRPGTWQHRVWDRAGQRVPPGWGPTSSEGPAFELGVWGRQDVAGHTLGQGSRVPVPVPVAPPRARVSHQSCRSCPRRSGLASAPPRQVRT